MIGIEWNCRGIGHPSTLRSLRGFINSHRPDFVFLSEIKCTDAGKIRKFVTKCGFCMHEFVPSVGKSWGLLVMWKQDINLKVVVSSSSCINCLIFTNTSPNPWLLTCVYGPPVPTHRHQFWNMLDNIDQSHKGPWLFIGDFNSVLLSKEKQGGKTVASSNNGMFMD